MKTKITRRKSIGGIVALLCVWFVARAPAVVENPPARVPLESTSLASAGYDATARLLEIEFRSGAIYRYREVPATVFAEMMKAESKGRYFAQRIRGKFSCELLRERKK